MELKALDEVAPAVVPYAVGTVVELDAGTGTISEVFTAPNGETYYAIDYKLPNGEISHAARWHDEIALHPIDAAVMAIADDTPAAPAANVLNDDLSKAVWTPTLDDVAGTADRLASALVTGGAPSIDSAQLGVGPSIDDKFKAMLDKSAAIFASIGAIKPGDLVVLRSGGPQMIVEKIDGATDLMCWWMDHTANLHVARFNRLLVELVPSFNHAELRA